MSDHPPATLLAPADHFLDEATSAVTPPFYNSGTFARNAHYEIRARGAIYSRLHNPTSELALRPGKTRLSGLRRPRTPVGTSQASNTDTVHSDECPEWFYPEWAVKASYNTAITVPDTDSALGRYNQYTNSSSVKDLARIHGHLCDGLVIAYVAIRGVFGKLFPDGVVNPADLRVVAKNGPCWIDAAALMTGAGSNFKTLRVDDDMVNRNMP